MTFDSSYRRIALQRWEAEKADAQEELTEATEALGDALLSPFQRLMTTIRTWLALT